MSVPRLLTVVLLALLASVAVVPWAGREVPAPTAATGVPTSTPALDRAAPALDALREWDRQRAAAWRRGSPAALAGLYAAGSTAGAADRALLAAYAERGLRVTGMRMQRASVRVLASGERKIVLEVVDRLVGAVAVRRGTRVALPTDRWSRRRVVLVRLGERWRVGEVRNQTA